jgi:hypothetical protein
MIEQLLLALVLACVIVMIHAVGIVHVVLPRSLRLGTLHLKDGLCHEKQSFGALMWYHRKDENSLLYLGRH